MNTYTPDVIYICIYTCGNPEEKIDKQFTVLYYFTRILIYFLGVDSTLSYLQRLKRRPRSSADRRRAWLPAGLSEGFSENSVETSQICLYHHCLQRKWLFGGIGYIIFSYTLVHGEFSSWPLRTSMIVSHGYPKNLDAENARINTHNYQTNPKIYGFQGNN